MKPVMTIIFLDVMIIAMNMEIMKMKPAQIKPQENLKTKSYCNYFNFSMKYWKHKVSKE